jgi:hypothetical protein
VCGRPAVLVVNELRSDAVESRFMEAFGAEFVIRRVSKGRLDAEYSHPAIEVLLLKRRRRAAGSVLTRLSCLPVSPPA